MRADFNEGPMINVTIRRTHIYEDAFEKLSPSNGKHLQFIYTYVFYMCSAYLKDNDIIFILEN